MADNSPDVNKFFGELRESFGDTVDTVLRKFRKLTKPVQIAPVAADKIFAYETDVIEPLKKQHKISMVEEVDTWKLSFAKDNAVADFNAARRKAEVTDAKITETNVLKEALLALSQCDHYLAEAEETLTARRQLAEAIKEFKKDLVAEQPIDIAFTMLLSLRKDWDHLNNDARHAAIEQVLTASNVSTAIQGVILGAIDIKQSVSEGFKALAEAVALNITAIGDIATGISLTAKSIVNPIIPEAVLDASEDYIAGFRASYDEKMLAFLNILLAQVKKSIDDNHGLLPANPIEHARVVLLMKHAREYISSVKKRIEVLEQENFIAIAGSEEEKKITERLEALTNALLAKVNTFEKDCEALLCWKPLSSVLGADTSRKIRESEMITLRNVLGVDPVSALGDVFDDARKVIDLMRALDEDPDVVAASRTVKILKANPAYDVANDSNVFSSLEAEAAFLVGLHAQHERGKQAINRVLTGKTLHEESLGLRLAKKIGFSFQSTAGHQARLSAQSPFHARKLKLVDALIAKYGLLSNKDSDDEFNAFYQSISGVSAESQEDAVVKKRILFVLQTLSDLKNPLSNATESELRFNKKVDAIIDRVLNKVEPKFYDERIVLNSTTKQWSLQPLEVAKLTKNEADEIKANNSKRMAEALLQLKTPEKEITKTIESIRQRCGELQKRKSNKSSEELRDLSNKLIEIENIYLKNTKTLLLRSDKSNGSNGVVEYLQGELTKSEERLALGAEYAVSRNHDARARELLLARAKRSEALVINGSGMVVERTPEEKVWNAYATRYLTQDEYLTVRAKFKKHLALIESRVEVIKERKKNLDSYLASGAHIRDTSIPSLEKRALYLATLLPGELKSLADSFESVSVNAESELKSDRLLAEDVIQRQEDIAISMFQRLRVAYRKESADLLFTLGLAADESRLPIYAVSEDTVRAYYHFIYQYGSLELITQLEKELPASVALFLSGEVEPFEIAHEHYASVVEFEEVDSRLLRSEDRKQLDTLSRNIQSATTYAREFSIYQRDTKKGYEDFKNKTKFIPDFLKNHTPKAYLDSAKKTFSEKVSEFISPLKVIRSEWATDLEARRIKREKNYNDQLNVLGLKLVSERTAVDREILDHEKRKKELEKKGAVNKFFRDVFSFIPFVDSIEKCDHKIKKLNENWKAKKEPVLNAEVANLNQTRLLGRADETDFIRKEVVKKIGADLDRDRLSVAEFKEIRAFVENSAPNLLVEFDREASFLRRFIEGIEAHKNIEALSSIAQRLQAFESNAQIKANVDVLFKLIKGEYLPSRDDSEWLAKKAVYEKADRAAGIPDTEYTVDEWLSSLSQTLGANYTLSLAIEPYIADALVAEILSEHNLDVSEAKFRALLPLAGSSQAVLEKALKKIGTDETKLFRLLKLKACFSNADLSVLKTPLEQYFSKRMQTAWLSDHYEYGAADGRRDFFVLAQARELLESTTKDADVWTSLELNLHETLDALNKKNTAWNPYRAAVIEGFLIGEDVVNDYRLLGWKQLFEMENLAIDANAAHQKFDAFKESMRLDEQPFQCDARMLLSMAQASQPSYMVDLMLNEFSDKEIHQATILRWLQAHLTRMERGEWKRQDQQNDTVLADIIKKNSTLLSAEILSEIKQRFIQAGDVAIKQEDLTLKNDTNFSTTVLQDNPEAERKMIFSESKAYAALSRHLENMDVKNSQASQMSSPSKTSEVTENFAKQIFAVLTKEYFLRYRNVAVSSENSLTAREMVSYLLMTEEDRAAERKQALERLEKEKSAKPNFIVKQSAQETDAKSEKSHARRHIQDENADSTELAEPQFFPFINFLSERGLNWGVNPNQRYDYAKNPELFFSELILKLQPLAAQFIDRDLLPENLLADENELADLVRAVKETTFEIIDPISHFSYEDHVLPLLTNLSDPHGFEEFEGSMKTLLKAYADVVDHATLNAANELLERIDVKYSTKVPALNLFLKALSEGVKLQLSVKLAQDSLLLIQMLNADVVDHAATKNLIDRIQFFYASTAEAQPILASRVCALYASQMTQWVETAKKDLTDNPFKTSIILESLHALLDVIPFKDDFTRELKVIVVNTLIESQNLVKKLTIEKFDDISAADIHILKSAVGRLIDKLISPEVLSSGHATLEGLRHLTVLLQNAQLVATCAKDVAFSTKVSEALKSFDILLLSQSFSEDKNLLKAAIPLLLMRAEQLAHDKVENANQRRALLREKLGKAMPTVGANAMALGVAMHKTQKKITETKTENEKALSLIKQLVSTYGDHNQISAAAKFSLEEHKASLSPAIFHPPKLLELLKKLVALGLDEKARDNTIEEIYKIKGGSVLFMQKKGLNYVLNKVCEDIAKNRVDFKRPAFLTLQSLYEHTNVLESLQEGDKRVTAVINEMEKHYKKDNQRLSPDNVKKPAI